MTPTVTPTVPAPQPAATQTAQKAALPQAQTARSSVGEKSAANIRAETAIAIDAPDQTPVSARLRDQETAEQTRSLVIEELVGPEPTFEESPLERQARVALDPPEITESPDDPEPAAAAEQPEAPGYETPEPALTEPPPFEDPPPTPSEKAEASFVETRTIAEGPEPATIDIAR